MKIKIDKSGYLNIERAGAMASQLCVYNKTDLCGDHCPLFDDTDIASGVIGLCTNKTIKGEIIDERPWK